MKRILYIFILIGTFAINLIAEENEEDIKNKLPLIQGISNSGKEFVFTIPPVYEESGINNLIKIYVTSSIVTNVKLEVKKYNKVETKQTIPNDVIAFDLTPTEGQPFLYNPYNMKGKPAQIWDQAGIRITSEDPIVVYVMCKYRYTSDGFLALPVSGLGREYIAATYNDMGWSGTHFFPPWVGITAAYDNTDIHINMGGNTSSEILTIDGAKIKPGQFIPRQRLQKGDVYMFSSNGPFQDITGSKIVANKPISVVSGHFCTNIPLTNQWCDYTVDMQLPTNTWGKVYHLPAYNPRRYPGIIRVFAKEDNTNVYRDGQFWFNLKKSIGTEGNGWREERIWPKSQENGQDQRPKNAVISADKPIGITFYNPGTQEDGGIINQADSDPFIMTMIPYEQYQNEITFSTPSVKGGDKFGRNFINVVFELNQFGFMPDDFEFAEIKGGNFEWKSFNEVFGGAGTAFVGGVKGGTFDVSGVNYGSKQVLLPNDGVFKLRSKTGKFACYSYGFNAYESYGYPTSTALNDLTIPDVWKPKPDWTQEKNGSVNGKVTDMPFPGQDNLRSNLGYLYLEQNTSYNYKFEFNPIEGGATITTSWKLTVLDPFKDARADIFFIDRAGNDTTIRIEYKKLPAYIPLTVNFSKQICDSSVVVYETAYRNYFKYNWTIYGNHELISKDSNKLTLKWVNEQLSNVRLIRENTLDDAFDTLIFNLKVVNKPKITNNLLNRYCANEIKNIDLEFDDSNIEYIRFLTEIIKDNQIIYHKTLNNIIPKKLNVFSNELDKGDYIIKYYYNTVAGCTDTIQFKFTVIKNELKPRISIEKDYLIINNVVGNEFLWYRNDSLIERSSNNYLKPVLSGLYNCQITDENGCLSDLSNEVPIFINSIEDNQFISIKNVNKNSIELINNKESLNVNKYQIVDILGNTYPYTIENTNNTITIKFNQPLLIGSYILQMNSNRNTQIYKFIINE